VKALVLTEANLLEFQDVATPQIAPDEVLVRVCACGICGSDVHGMDGSTGRRRPPIIMGHEAAGLIAEVGSEVDGWNVDDRVTFDSTLWCGRCWFCRRGQINLCDDRRVLGVSCQEYRRDGAFAEYVAVPQRILYRLPETVTFEQAAMVEPLSVAVHAVNLSNITAGDTAVVVGAGMIGLLAVQVLRAVGCGQVIAVDLEPHKLELARSLGADAGLHADKDDVIREILRRTDGRGADVAMEVVGTTPALKTAVNGLRKGGQLTLVGNLSPEVQLPLQSIVTREIRVAGSCASCGEYPQCLEMIANGTVDVDPLISITGQLSEGALWFHRLFDGNEQLLKVILQPEWGG